MAAIAEELGVDPAAVLRMCRDRGIRASWEESELSDESVAMLRQAVATPDPDAPVAPPPVNPAIVAAAPLVAPAPPTGTVAAGERPPDPAFGSVDPRFAAAAQGEILSEAKTEKLKRPLTPEVVSATKAIVVAVVAALLYVLARVLPDWDESRWWLLGAIFAIVALVAALAALLFGVQGVLEVMRFPRARRGKVQGALIAAAAAGVLLVVALVGAYDWSALNVPDAYGRLQDTVMRTKNRTTANFDSIQGSIPTGQIPPQGVEMSVLSVGICIDLNVDLNVKDGIVSCDKVHGYEVVAINDLGGGARPSNIGSLALEACKAPFFAYVGSRMEDSTLRVIATYPSAAQWAAGEHRGACIAQSRGRAAGSVQNTKK